MAGGPKPVVESAIMEATREALAEEGYRELSFETVATGCEYDEGTLDRYYDDTTHLVASFLEYESDRFAELVMLAPEEPHLRLRVLLEALVGLDTLDADGLLEPYLELYVQALRDERIQASLDSLHSVMYDSLVETIEAGVEVGCFDPVDPDLAASAIFSVHEAALRQEALGNDSARLRDALDQFVLADIRSA
ncbi:TetR/AcrR family transcriptional regulator [Haloarchaeobius amylolyticus]|uniref:TetR/AcrR family transcriptional regulator n=1 Tax=Haloarchaeobius amylolyticus TaxID=1198296 RepID=UPI0022704FC9|nr:TetR/AcrR family transcriptional regulator [Haloarchaeobius amylolyticus]